MCERLAVTKESLGEEDFKKVKDFEERSNLMVVEVNRMDDGKIVPTLINGRPVDRADWPEVVRIGNRSCTGTVVGNNCVITAAHCGNHNSRSTLELHTGERVSYRMVHHPRYRNGSNWDVALLVLENNLMVNPARVGIDYQFVNGKDVDIAGYGCTRMGGGGGNDGVLRWGESKVQGFTGTDVITSWRPGGAALCFGDSGGPMFADKSDVSTTDTNTLIAVNSKGNIRDTNYNMRLDLDAVVEWLKASADRYGLQILGVTESVDPIDPPDQSFTDVWSQQAKDHRALMATHEELAEKYEAMISTSGTDSPSGGDGENGKGKDISDITFGM